MMGVREYVYDVSLSAGVPVTQQAHGSQGNLQGLAHLVL